MKNVLVWLHSSLFPALLAESPRSCIVVLDNASVYCSPAIMEAI